MEIDKHIAELLLPFHSQRTDMVAFLPAPDKKRETHFRCVQKNTALRLFHIHPARPFQHLNLEAVVMPGAADDIFSGRSRFVNDNGVSRQRSPVFS